jgi:hypothetical protein
MVMHIAIPKCSSFIIKKLSFFPAQSGGFLIPEPKSENHYLPTASNASCDGANQYDPVTASV